MNKTLCVSCLTETGSPNRRMYIIIMSFILVTSNKSQCRVINGIQGLQSCSWNMHVYSTIIRLDFGVIYIRTTSLFEEVLNLFPRMLLYLQWQFPVLSGGQHVSAAAAGRRTHGISEPGPVLRFDIVQDQFHIVPMSGQGQSAGEWTDAVTQAWWEPVQ